MSIKDNFPSVGPSLSLNFARSKTLDPRITFSRASSSGDATYMNGNGLIVTAAADEPRFDHKIENGVVKSLGLLVEEQRTNLFIRGSTVGDVGTQPAGLNYATTPTGQSAVVSSDFDVDGNDKSIKHTRGSSGDNNVGYYSVAGLTTGVTHSFSTYVYIPSSQQSSITSIRFGPDNNYSNLEYGYADTNIVDRWQRVVGKYDPSTQTSNVICRATASGGTYFYTDAWQLEEGAFATSYIPTTSSTKTRSKDSVSMEGTNFSDWFNPTEGTIHMRLSSLQGPTSGYNRFLMLTPAGQNSQNNSLQFIFTNSPVGTSYALWEGGTIRRSYNKNVTGSSDKENAVFAYKSDGDTNVYVDGNSLTNSITSNGYAQPTFGRMGIGAYPGGEGTAPRITIENLNYYPRRLTNTQLQNLTK